MRDSGHCSGYQAVPTRRAGRAEAWDSAELLAQRQGARRISKAVKQHTARFFPSFDTTALPGDAFLFDTEDWNRVYLTFLCPRIQKHLLRFRKAVKLDVIQPCAARGLISCYRWRTEQSSRGTR